MGIDEQALHDYVSEVLARRPREWSCCNFMEGWLRLHAPAVAAVLAETLPRPVDLLNAHIQFQRDNIRDAASYRDKAVEYSQGMLAATDDPIPGDLAFTRATHGDVSHPTGGIVTPYNEAVFLTWRGEALKLPMYSQEMKFAGVADV